MSQPDKPERIKGRRNWKPAWLEAYLAHGTVTAACDTVGIGTSTAYDARARDDEFRSAWDAAEDKTTKLLEETLFERAVNGDTTAAIFMLKARRPGKYRESFNVRHGGTVKVESDVDAEIRELLGDMDRREQAEAARGGEGQAVAANGQHRADGAAG